MDPTPPAAPAPPETTAPTTASDTLAALTPKDMQTWRETGDLPVREPIEPSEEGDDEPEPAAAPVTVGAPAAVSKRQQRINDQIREAVGKATADKDAELARLRAAQPAQARQDPPVRSAPAPELKADPNDPEPDPTDTTTFPGGEYDPKYLRAAAAWDNRQDRRKEQAAAQARARQDHETQAFRTNAKATADAWAAKKTADPTFESRLDQALLESLIPASQIPVDPSTGRSVFPVGPLNVMAQEMLDHPATAPDVAEYLSTHRDDLARLTATDPQTGVPILSARQLIREMGRIEGALQRGLDPPPPPNTITGAPAPPTTLGSRATTPVDASESAVKRGDYESYRAAENAKELAARK